MNFDELDIVVHAEPADYYAELRRLIQFANEHIILSALYLGSGPKEAQLLEDVAAALEAKPNLTVAFILDHSRARRGEKSSIDLLTPLVNRFHPRLKVSFYQMPQLRTAPYAWLPFWLQEVVAVYHCKFCVADESALVTGANMSHDYFTDRQDRYWTITNGNGVNPLSTYLTAFARAVAQDSWSLPPGIGSQPMKSPRQENAVLTFAEEQKKVLKLYTQEERQSSSPSLSTSSSSSVHVVPLIQHNFLGIQQEENYLVSQLSRQVTGSQGLSDLVLRAVQLCTPYTNLPQHLADALVALSLTPPSPPKAAPTSMSSLSASASSGPTATHVQVEIVGPSPQCHGFAGGHGFRANIPYIHEAALELRLSAPSDAQGARHQITWRQYDRPGWTLHRKGLWLGYSSAPKPDTLSPTATTASTSSTTTTMATTDSDSSRDVRGDAMRWSTYIGSSNFGERSWQRDFELGFFFHFPPHPNPDSHRETNSSGSVLQRVLQQETLQLRETSRPYAVAGSQVDYSHHRINHTHSYHSHTHHSSINHSDQKQVIDENVQSHSRQPLLASNATAVGPGHTNAPPNAVAPHVNHAGMSRRPWIRVLAWVLRSVL